METTENTNPEGLEPKFILSGEALNYLNETQKWTKFLSIIIFISCGLFIIFGLFFSFIMGRLLLQTTQSPEPGFQAAMTLFYIIIAVIYFFPGLYLYKFSPNLEEALINNNQEVLTTATKNLNRFFKYIGILTIVMLVIYALALLGFMFA